MDPTEYVPAKAPYKLIPMPKEVPARLATDEPAGQAKASPSAPSAPKCSKCQSQRIVTGSVCDSHRVRCFFAPDGLKFWTITKSYGTKVDSYACIDCGLVWLQTSPKMLEDFVRNYCDQKLD